MGLGLHHRIHLYLPCGNRSFCSLLCRPTLLRLYRLEGSPAFAAHSDGSWRRHRGEQFPCRVRRSAWSAPRRAATPRKRPLAITHRSSRGWHSSNLSSVSIASSVCSNTSTPANGLSARSSRFTLSVSFQ